MAALILFCFVICGVVPAWADDFQIKIQNAWLQAVPPVANSTAAYMKIINLGRNPLKLVGAFSPLAGAVEPMITTRQERNGEVILGMQSVENLEISAGAMLDLKPGGNHLMFMGLRWHPKEGERVKVSLRFAPGDHRFDVELPVFKQEPK